LLFKIIKLFLYIVGGEKVIKRSNVEIDQIYVFYIYVIVIIEEIYFVLLQIGCFYAFLTRQTTVSTWLYSLLIMQNMPLTLLLYYVF